MFCGNCGKQIDDGAKFCSFCGARQDEQETGEAVSGAQLSASNTESFGRSDARGGAPKKPYLMSVIAMALAAIAAVAAVFFGVRFLTGMSKPEDKVFFWEDDELRAIADITDPDPDDVEIAETESYLVKISEDNAYLYFYGNISSDGTRGDVCRIPIAKIKNAKTDVEKIVEDVVDDVSTNFEYDLLEDNSIVYVKNENELNWYNGEESFELGELGSGYDYQISEDEKHVIYKDEDGVLLATEPSENAETIEIADDVSSYYLTDQDGLCLYYMVAEEKERSLYDYVYDAYADEDAKAVEPTYADFMGEVKLKDAVSDYDLGRYANKEEFISDVIANCYWDSSLGAYKYVNTDDYKSYYYNPDRKKWYSEPDYNAYDAAYGKYEAAMERNSLREELKSSSVNDTYYSLYFYENGSIAEICGSVEMMVANDGGAVIYTKKEENGAASLSVNIDSIESISDVEWAVENSEGTDENGDTFYFVYDGGSEGTVSGLKYISNMRMAEDGSGLAVIGKEDPSDDQTKMSYFGLSSGKLGDEVEVSDECNWFNVYQNKFYYFADMDLERGDLYEFDGKESHLLAKDAVSYSCFVAEDGTVAGYSNNDADRLVVFDKDGKDSTIAKNVERFTYIGDGCFLIMKDGDLYYLDKKGNDHMLARDVTYYVCPRSAKGCLA